MEGISISSERVVAAGIGVDDVSTRLTREIATMGDLLGEIRSGWQSDQAAPRFASSLQGYLDQATVLRNALVSHGQTLVSTGHSFAEAEANLAAGISGGAVMATIKADYGVMSAGHDGLVATWQRIESHLADLDRVAASTHDMRADALVSYQALKTKWVASAADRQLVLKSLAELVAQARDHYLQVDAALAAQFAG